MFYFIVLADVRLSGGFYGVNLGGHNLLGTSNRKTGDAGVTVCVNKTLSAVFRVATIGGVYELSLDFSINRKLFILLANAALFIDNWLIF